MRILLGFKSKTFDVGFDFEAWNGLLGVSFDYFNRLRTGRFARRTGDLPTVVGASAPRENLDSDRQFGMELELTHRNKIGQVAYNLKGIATVTRQKYLTASEKGPWANSYDRWRNDNLTNRYQGVQFGYTSAGRYTSWNDIWSYPGTRNVTFCRVTTNMKTGMVTVRLTVRTNIRLPLTRLHGCSSV